MDIDDAGENQSDDWLTAREVTEYFPGASTRSIQNWLRAGKFKGAFLLPSKRWTVPLKSVLELRAELEGKNGQ